jgi:hypothetical protein
MTLQDETGDLGIAAEDDLTRAHASSILKRNFDQMNNATSMSAEDRANKERCEELWRQRNLNLNMQFVKLSASCSKTMQPSDVMSGFLNIHQFLAGAQFCLFDPSKMSPPAELDMVKNILRNVPSASRENFIRFFYAKDFLTDTCISKSNVIQGYIMSGFNRVDGKSGPNFLRVLQNCPTIVAIANTMNKADSVKFYDDLLKEREEVYTCASDADVEAIAAYEKKRIDEQTDHKKKLDSYFKMGVFLKDSDANGVTNEVIMGDLV